jgi:riboflavin kinase / FMN adenylyltransferase
MKAAELKDLKNIPVTFSLGSFDGLHKGHAVLLNRLKSVSVQNNSKAAVISFYPHPRQIVDSAFHLKLLNDREEKMDILSSFGIDFIHFINFTNEFALTDFEDFYENYIFANFTVKSIIAGENHGFGRNRKGNSSLLEIICRKHSVEVVTVEPYIYKDATISSTRIRHCIEEGKIGESNFMLGYEYSLKGIVAKGKGIGRNLGFSTANISLEGNEKVIPGGGVYLTRVNLQGSEFFGISNIGYRPTADLPGSPLLLETHIFDFDTDLYGKEIKVSFLEKIRDEIKFESLQDLKFAIEKDVKFAKFQISKYRAAE